MSSDGLHSELVVKKVSGPKLLCRRFGVLEEVNNAVEPQLQKIQKLEQTKNFMRVNLSSMTQVSGWSAYIGWPVKMCLASGCNAIPNCARETCTKIHANRQDDASGFDARDWVSNPG